MNFKVRASLTVILFAACSTAADGDTNLAPNPSFEQAEGFVADDWKTREGSRLNALRTEAGRTRPVSVSLMTASRKDRCWKVEGLRRGPVAITGPRPGFALPIPVGRVSI